MYSFYDVDRGAMDDRYCPYCNSCPLDGMTEEHVIPRSIGGSSCSVIKVCVRCNSNAGSIVDPWLGRNSLLKFIALGSGNLMNRHERHESNALLLDGIQLQGYIYWIEIEKGQVSPRFYPSKYQPDGSQWISEEACGDPTKIPSHLNIYRHEMLDTASVTLARPAEDNLKPALVKILLGANYLIRGRDIVMLPGFSIMRNCLYGVLDPRVTVTWIESQEAFTAKKLSLHLKAGEHSVWGECPDGHTFHGGVILFGSVAAEIVISDFGQPIDGIIISLMNPWLS